MAKMGQERKEPDRLLKELKSIKNLMILSLLKSDATLEEVNFATGMGKANISRMFPVKRGRKRGENP
jgi:hypothetical protein